MKVGEINLLSPIKFENFPVNNNKNTDEIKGFEDFLKESLDKVNNKIIKADGLTQDAIAGKVNNVQDVLIAAEEARLSLELTVQIRNKMVEAYQEMNRMQF